MKSRGFTMVEVLIAMVLALAVLGPTTLWLFKNRINQSPFDKAEALDALTLALHKSAVLPPPERSWQEELPKGWKLKVEVYRLDPEILLRGTVEDKTGRILATLSSARFVEAP